MGNTVARSTKHSKNKLHTAEHNHDGETNDEENLKTESVPAEGVPEENNLPKIAAEIINENNDDGEEWIKSMPPELIYEILSNLHPAVVMRYIIYGLSAS
jgi:hypothetical protein